MLQKVEDLEDERRDAYCRPLSQEDEYNQWSATSSTVDALVGDAEQDDMEDIDEHPAVSKPTRRETFREQATQTAEGPDCYTGSSG